MLNGVFLGLCGDEEGKEKTWGRDGTARGERGTKEKGKEWVCKGEEGTTDVRGLMEGGENEEEEEEEEGGY